MTDIHMADISEFQANIDAPTYLGSGYRVVICRTHNGHRPDRKMPARRVYLRQHPFTGIGWYQYLVSGRDAAQQAHEFINSLGNLRDNEWPILDLEEGSGNQTARAEAWFAVVDRWCGFKAMLYSGESFLRTNLGGSAHWSGRPIWIAAYPASFSDNLRSEPPDAHSLWQFSDRFHFPGITGPTDASVHHGTAAEFISSVRGGHAPNVQPDVVHPTPAPKPPTPPKDATMQSPNPYTTHDGRTGFVVTTDHGEVKFIEQQHPPGSGENSDFWKDKDAKPQWRSLGKP